MPNKFIAWIKLFFAPSNDFMPDEDWKAEHDRINEDHITVYEPLVKATKDEKQS